MIRSMDKSPSGFRILDLGFRIVKHGARRKAQGVADGELGQKLRDERAANAEAIYAKDAALQESLKG